MNQTSIISTRAAKTTAATSSFESKGRIITRLVDALRQDGYGAQAGHPLNGLALYPLIAQKAGLGWAGRAATAC